MILRGYYYFHLRVIPAGNSNLYLPTRSIIISLESATHIFGESEEHESVPAARDSRKRIVAPLLYSCSFTRARCSVKPTFNDAVAMAHSKYELPPKIQLGTAPSISRIRLRPFSTNPISLGCCGSASFDRDRGISK